MRNQILLCANPLPAGEPIAFFELIGQIPLTGAHYGVDTTTQTSADSFLPFYVNQLNTLMAPTGFSVTQAPIPEPTALALAGLAAAAGAGRWLRKRRRVAT